jgi:hypothetical protein
MSDERFARIFRLNVERRSRTAKGQDKGAETSKKKKPLLLQGDALSAKVAENTELLITDVRIAAKRPARAPIWPRPKELRAMCERWFDIVNDGVYGPDAYAEEIAALEKAAESLGPILGRELRVDRRYRLWTPEYTNARIPPVLVDAFMDDFYLHLATLVAISADGLKDAPAALRNAWASQLMALADCAMDGEIHPWMDGCGRVSTALVMWISRVCGVSPPLFAETKDGHYRTIRDLEAHAAYYQACIAHGQASPD